MKNHALPLAAASVLLLAACSDRPTSVDPAGFPEELLQPSMSVLDGSHGGNAHFFWLPSIGDDRRGFAGTADGDLFPVVEICPRNSAGDGCAAGPPLASYTRDTGADKDRITVDDKDQYFVHWRMSDYTPSRQGIYRIRVLIQGEEVGHADVIALRQNEIRAYQSQGGTLVPVSDKGAFKISFRLEEGVLAEQFCDYDGDTDVQDCDAAQETAGDGQSTTVVVTGTTGEGEVVAAVITAPDGVFTDVDGNPIPNVVVTAEVELGPPSFDVFTDDDQEIPFFVEVNTFPGDVYMDPNGPGVSVVICQDESVLDARGIEHPLHPQLILYKVSDGGTTRRLVSTFGAPECEGPAPAPAPSGLLGMLRDGAGRVLGLLGPEPLVARRRLHGGLNTVITRDVSLDEAFSTFGSALGPNADSSFAVLPASTEVGTPVAITIQLRNAIGENFVMGGDTLEITVRGANPTGPLVATDAGNGLHSAGYTATNAGVDSVDVILIRADGVGLGPIGASPYLVTVTPPPSPGGPFYWHPASGGNGHWYDYVEGYESWTDAEAAAEGMSHLGLPGHLVTITSAAEQAFVNSIRTDSLGLADWRPWIGLSDAASEGSFAWVTGEPLGYTNWGAGEPNNQGGVEDWVEMFASGVWNDVTNSPICPCGYLVEYEPPPPAISSVVPGSPGGAGQGLTVFGSNMDNPLWIFTPAPSPGPAPSSIGEGASGPRRVANTASMQAFVLLAPSTSTVQYIWTSGIPEGDYLVTVTDQVTGRSSAPFPYTLGSQYGTPTLVGVFNGSGDLTPATTIASGATIYIQGYGIYTTGTDACFTQGSAPSAGPGCAGTLVGSTSAVSGPSIGLRAEVTAPALASGTVWIQIRSGNSDFTAPVALTVP